MSSDMRGVVLAGGTGSRLGELSKVTNKHLLPVGAWPMIYHPINKLVTAGITDITVVTGTEHMGDFVRLLGSGKRLGCRLTYRVQDEPGGIAQALAVSDTGFTGKTVVLLGDNIFKDDLSFVLDKASNVPSDTATLALHRVYHTAAKAFGCAEVINNKITRIVEKPDNPLAEFNDTFVYVVTGIYVYPPDVFEVIPKLKLSARGEYEITDVNNYYLAIDKLSHEVLTSWWTDAGTLESYKKANNYAFRS